jgi:quinol monooxygenase YgiN
MSKIIVFASFYPKINKKNEVKKIIQSMISPTRSEVGNEFYNLYEEKNDDTKDTFFHLFEVYKNTDSLNFHRKTSHYKNYRFKIINLLKKPIEVKILNSLDSI